MRESCGFKDSFHEKCHSRGSSKKTERQTERGRKSPKYPFVHILLPKERAYPRNASAQDEWEVVVEERKLIYLQRTQTHRHTIQRTTNISSALESSWDAFIIRLDRHRRGGRKNSWTILRSEDILSRNQRRKRRDGKNIRNVYKCHISQGKWHWH